jgi:galactokinase
MTSLDHSRATHRTLVGGTPEKIFSAPGRVNLIGEHTDYNGGLVLPVAISERTWVAVSPRHDTVVSVASDVSADVREWDLNAGPPVGLDWALYPLGVAWLLHQEYGLPHGVNLSVTSTVPIGAGLSSSAALEAATAFAIASYMEGEMSPLQLALVAQKAENTIVGAPTGLMDQVASIFSRANHATLIDFSTVAISHHPFDLDGANLTLAVIDTQVKHSHATGGYRTRREECSQALNILGAASLSDVTTWQLEDASADLGPLLTSRVRHIITENERVRATIRQLDQGSVDGLGDLFAASHDSLRDDYEISCVELDAAVEESYQAGAVAARMTGGGFGGSALAIVPTQHLAAFTAQVTKRFASDGFHPPHIFTTAVSAGARQEG